MKETKKEKQKEQKLKYYNNSHEVVVETLKKANVKINYPIYLIGDRKSDHYNVSCNFMSVEVTIPKNLINEDEIYNLPKECQIQLRTVWSWKG
jgi:hypothetical protein